MARLTRRALYISKPPSILPDLSRSASSQWQIWNGCALFNIKNDMSEVQLYNPLHVCVVVSWFTRGTQKTASSCCDNDFPWNYLFVWCLYQLSLVRSESIPSCNKGTGEDFIPRAFPGISQAGKVGGHQWLLHVAAGYWLGYMWIFALEFGKPILMGIITVNGKASLSSDPLTNGTTDQVQVWPDNYHGLRFRKQKTCGKMWIELSVMVVPNQKYDQKEDTSSIQSCTVINVSICFLYSHSGPTWLELASLSENQCPPP